MTVLAASPRLLPRPGGDRWFNFSEAERGGVVEVGTTLTTTHELQKRQHPNAVRQITEPPTDPARRSAAFAVLTTAHPAQIPQEFAGRPPPAPGNPARRRSKGPALARESPLPPKPEMPRPACHTGARRAQRLESGVRCAFHLEVRRQRGDHSVPCCDPRRRGMSARMRMQAGDRFWGQVRGFSGTLRAFEGEGAADRRNGVVAGETP